MTARPRISVELTPEQLRQLRIDAATLDMSVQQLAKIRLTKREEAIFSVDTQPIQAKTRADA